MYLVEVSPFKKIKGIKKLSYFSNTSFERGDIIEVPFRNTNILSIVTKSEKLEKVKTDVKNENFTLKKITAQSPKNKFSQEFINACFYSAKYFIKEVASIVSAVTPKIILENLNSIPNFTAYKNDEKELQDFDKVREKILTAFETERYEHYKALVRQELASKNSILIIAPNLKVAQAIYDNVSTGISQMVLLVRHDRKKDILNLFQNITDDKPKCYIGTYKSLSLPIKNLNLIILDSAGASSYKLLKYPKIDIKVFAKKLAENLKIDILLADSFLPLEEYLLNEHEKNIAIDHTPKKIRKKTFVRLIDLNKEIQYSKEYKLKYPLISREILGQISMHISENKKVFLHAPKKGISSQITCNDCAYTLTCPKCKANLRLSKDTKSNENKLLCYRCGYAMSSNVLCFNCGSWRLFEIGFGIDAYINYLKEHLSNLKILAFDADKIKTEKEAQAIIREFKNSSNSILIGTSKALFYLSENDVHYSAVLNIDSLFAAPDFKIEENVFATLIKILEKSSEKMDVQVKNTEQRIINFFYKKNIKDFIKTELQLRKKLMWPPFVRLVKIRVKSNKRVVIKLMQEFLNEFYKYKPRIFKDFIHIDKNTVELDALIRIPSDLWPHGVNALISKLELLSSDFEIEIDPEEI